MIRPWVRRVGWLALVAVVLVGIMIWGADRLRRAWAPDPATIATASLQGLREQNRLSALVASYVAVVTSTQTRFGLSARKTLILPGTVRYEVDLGRLGARDVVWNAGAKSLDVTLPPVEVAGPQIDLTRMREYDGGGLLLRFSDAVTALDASNRRAAHAELLRQAREPVPMNLAKDATRRAIASSFALPLRAAGLDATVRVRFPDEPGFPLRDASTVERSRALEDVYRN